MQKYIPFIITLLLFSPTPITAGELPVLTQLDDLILPDNLNGSLSNDLYTSKDGVFITKLPNKTGELREYPNGVSVYSVFTGAQDSLEFFSLAPFERDYYRNLGDKKFISTYIGKHIIEKRLKPAFKNILIDDIKFIEEGNTKLLILTMYLKESSQITDGTGKRKDMWIALGGLVQGKKLFLYQVAKTDIEGNKADQLKSGVQSTITDWVLNTTFNG